MITTFIKARYSIDDDIAMQQQKRRNEAVIPPLLIFSPTLSGKMLHIILRILPYFAVQRVKSHFLT